MRTRLRYFRDLLCRRRYILQDRIEETYVRHSLTLKTEKTFKEGLFHCEGSIAQVMKNNATVTVGGSENMSAHGNEEHYNNSLLLEIVVLGFFSTFGVGGNLIILVTGVKQIWKNFRVPVFNSRQDYKTSLVTNLAVADILILVYGIPFHLIQGKMVPFSEFVCRFLVPLKDVLAVTSILTIMAISVERAVAIIRPFSLETSHSHEKYGIIAIWITAYLVAGLPMVFVMHSTDNKQCIPKWKDVKLAQVHQTSATLVIIIPGLVTTSCYMFSVRSLGKFRQRRKSSSDSSGIEQWTFVHQSRNVSRMAVILVVIFWVCNLPLAIYAISLYNRLINPSPKVILYTNAVLACLFFGASVINPIVLIAMSSFYKRRACSCLQYLFSKKNAIVRFHQRRRRFSKGVVSRTEDISIANEFALVTRQELVA